MKTKKNNPIVEKNRQLKLELENLLINRRIERLKNLPSNKYDIVNTNNEKKRRKAQIEMLSEEGILRAYDRLKAINVSRDLERNFTFAKSIIRQLKVNVVGTQGKMLLNTGNKITDQKVSDWFNKEYAHECDSRGDLHFNEMLQLTIASIVREGDVLIAFDDFDREDGKLLFWEADQIVKVNDMDWNAQVAWTEQVINKNGKKEIVPLQQESGVIYDRKGRVLGYSVTGKRGLTEAKYDEVTILPISVARLLMNPFRFNQLRGVGDMFAAASDLEDLYEIRAKELQSAKVASSFAGVVTKQDAIEEAILRGGTAPEGLLETADGTAEATSETENYDRLEATTGGYLEYMQPGEDFKIIDFNRPNVHLKEFFDFVGGNAGAAFGLARCYSTMQAYNSYTAFRGEMIMSWETIIGWQKYLERHFCDWVAIKAIGHAIKRGKLKVKLASDWPQKISWLFPKMPQVDPEKDLKAKALALKNALLDYSQLLGPDWQEKFIGFSKQIEKATALGLPLALFETKAGAPVKE